jgi:hypothetical protein
VVEVKLEKSSIHCLPEAWQKLSTLPGELYGNDSYQANGGYCCYSC